MSERSQRPAAASLAVTLAAVATLTAATSVAAEATAEPRSAVEAATTARVAPRVAAAPSFERWATLTRTSTGYYYDAGQQDTHLVITRVDGGLSFADTHTDVLRSKPDACDKKRSPVGIVVVCPVPSTVTARHPMTLKVFTRLGNDYVDTTALSAAFELYGLADWGNDDFRAGAGNDFVNGAKGNDRVSGGAGDDWIRTTRGNDHIWGGPGNDRLVGTTGRDVIRGGDGDDRVGGGLGNDRLYGDAGTDFVLCGGGADQAHVDRTDRIMADCETEDFG